MTYRPLDHLDHSLISPSGRLSKSAKKAATERLASQLFGPESGFEGWDRVHAQSSEKETLLRRASELRDLASRGMNTKKFNKEAARLEALAATLTDSERIKQ